MRAAILFAIGAGAAEAGAQDEAKAVREVRAAFRLEDTRETVGAKRAALAGLRGFDSARVSEALIDAYTRLEREAEPLRAQRHKRLLHGGGSGTLGDSRDDLQPIRDLQDAIVAMLRRLRARESVRAMLGRFLRAGSRLPLTLRIALAGRAGDLAAGGLAAGDLEKISDAAEGTTRTEDLLVLLQAVAGLGPRAERAAAWVVTQLEHGVEEVRVRAIRALAQLAWPGGIEPLIARIDVESGRAREEVLDALVVLTGAHPGDSAPSWRLWLAQEGGPFVRGEARLGRGDASVRGRRNDQATSSGTYFGIQQSGEAILYVFDVSRSMAAPADGRGRTRATDGAADPAVETRWDRCREELISALDGLAPTKTFNLVGFANGLEIFSERMERATPKNVARARKWVEQLPLRLQTNVHDALELAFVLAGRGARDRYYPSAVDTIFFLSDGAPTRPGADNGRRMQADDPRQILSAVRRWNALGRVVVHTIALGLRPERPRRGRGRDGGGGRGAGRPGPRQFMRELAEQNHGKFVEAR